MIAELCREMYRRCATTSPSTSRDIRQFIADWLKTKELEMSPGHYRFYKKIQAKFLEFEYRSGTGTAGVCIFHVDSELPLDSLCHGLLDKS